MLKKIIFAVIFIILGLSVYFVFIFDINNYKSELEDIISEKSNTELRISGDLELDIGTNTTIKAELLSVRKNDVLIIQTYSLLSGKRYSMKNRSYSNIESIDASGKYSDGMLQIDDIQIRTELLQADGFGKIIPDSESLSISAMATIADDTVTKEKFGGYYRIYLENTEVPILISGNFDSPEVDVKISDVIAQRIQQEIKNKAIESIKDKIKDKIQSDINIKLPF